MNRVAELSGLKEALAASLRQTRVAAHRAPTAWMKNTCAGTQEFRFDPPQPSEHGCGPAKK